MSTLDRRTLLRAFGLTSVSAMMSARAFAAGTVLATESGQNRFSFHNPGQAKASLCKVTSADSAGTCSIFQMNALARSGPFLHVHHREDEWYYVLSGEFLFKAGQEEHNFRYGDSIWLPRGIPHVWANTARTESKLILVWQPGGFEKFFDEIGSVPMDKKSPERMGVVMAKYGMEMLGPPIFASSWMQQH